MHPHPETVEGENSLTAPPTTHRRRDLLKAHFQAHIGSGNYGHSRAEGRPRDGLTFRESHKGNLPCRRFFIRDGTASPRRAPEAACVRMASPLTIPEFVPLPLLGRSVDVTSLLQALEIGATYNNTPDSYRRGRIVVADGPPGLQALWPASITPPRKSRD